MADLVDVENALVSQIAQVLYPTGVSGPTAPSITGVPVVIYAGWPTSSNLDADLLALSKNPPNGKIHVTVFPPKGMERNTTRYISRQWQQVAPVVQTLTMTINGQTVTVGGTVSIPQNVMMMVGYQPYIYAVQAGDTLASIAVSLAALVPGASAAAGVITLPSSAILTAARVGATAQAIKEIRRQEKIFMISVWADTPAHRDATVQAIDVAFADLAFLPFADTSAGRMIYKSTNVDDQQSKANLYRRDLYYTVEYGTYQVQIQTQIVATQTNVSAAVAGVPPYKPVATVFS